MNINLLFESVARQQRHLYGGNMKDARTIEGLVELIAELEKKHEEAVRILQNVDLMIDELLSPDGYVSQKTMIEVGEDIGSFLATQETK
jgi:ribosomal 50S subunit-associated protein YjgA (DUF615 family)